MVNKKPAIHHQRILPVRVAGYSKKSDLMNLVSVINYLRPPEPEDELLLEPEDELPLDPEEELPEELLPEELLPELDDELLEGV
jgi:hypothetical protein